MTTTEKIENMRIHLNAEITKCNFSLTDDTVLHISQELDKLLVEQHEKDKKAYVS